MLHVSHVTRHTSHVTRHTSHVTHNTPNITRTRGHTYVVDWLQSQSEISWQVGATTVDLNNDKRNISIVQHFDCGQQILLLFVWNVEVGVARSNTARSYRILGIESDGTRCNRLDNGVVCNLWVLLRSCVIRERRTNGILV